MIQVIADTCRPSRPSDLTPALVGRTFSYVCGAPDKTGALEAARMDGLQDSL